ncbi:COG0600 ABC-type nitrate sulfonate bicarbonate transport system [Vibrio sp. B1REV9]|nr:COG0600 ABC-type nitrate sulfonate bicarbonate transport system [Vibrio sp. B1REV9]
MSSNVISLFPAKQVVNRSRLVLLPVIGLLIFLATWHLAAREVQTSLGTLPGPVQTFQQFSNLVDDHWQEREKEQAFIERQEKRNAAKLAKNPDAEVKIRPYTGKPTFFDQIITSLVTVTAAFCWRRLSRFHLASCLVLIKGCIKRSTQSFNCSSLYHLWLGCLSLPWW